MKVTFPSMKISPFFILVSVISITAVLFVGLQLRKLQNRMNPKKSNSYQNANSCGCNCNCMGNKNNCNCKCIDKSNCDCNCNDPRGTRVLGDYENEFKSTKVERHREQYNNYFTRMP